MKKKQLILLRFILAASDLLLLNMCLFVGCYLANKYGSHPNPQFYITNVLPANALWIITTSIFRLYGEYIVHKVADINKVTWRSIIAYLIIFQLYIQLTSQGYPVQLSLVYFGLIVVFFLISRYSLSLFEHILNVNYTTRSASILAIASIGGHWIELQRLLPLFREHDVTFISNKEHLAKSVKGSKYYNVPDANKDRKFDLIKCFCAVLTRVIVLRPRVIITTGAAPGLMGILIGRVLGAKTIWIDSVANVEKLSLSGRIALKLADRVYTQWAHLAGPKVFYNGNLL
jgi:hypothetical protein